VQATGGEPAQGAAQDEASAEPMEGVETPKPAEDEGADEAAAPTAAPDDDSAPTAPEDASEQPRVITMIRGTPVDVTDLGIDPDYLDALPEEFREEVIAQAVSTRRSEARQQAATSGSDRSSDFQVFLDALPEAIRREVIEQERRDERRRMHDEQRRLQTGGEASRGPEMAADMDTASILMTLPAMLREQILNQQGGELIDHLPPDSDMAAQVRRAQQQAADDNQLSARTQVQQQMAQQRVHDSASSRIGHLFGHAGNLSAGGNGTTGAPFTISGTTPGPPPADKRRTVIQMLDKSGIATLLRLMFMSQQSDMRQSLFHVFENVCENRQNRLEVISTLVQVLQDGCTDMETIERTYGQISLRARKPKETPGKEGVDPKTPVLRRTQTDLSAAVAATAAGSLGPSTPALQLNSDVSPLLIITQCLDLLVDLCASNPHVPWMFLTEHDIPNLSLKRSSNKKGKGKDTKAHRFAINALLSLLERDTVMDSFGVMSHLAELLYKVTVPLQTMERRRKEAEEEAAREAKEKEEREKKEKEKGEKEMGNGGQDDGDTTVPDTAAAPETTTPETAAQETVNTTTTSDAAPTTATAGASTEASSSGAAAAAGDNVDQVPQPETITPEVQAKKTQKMIPPPPVIPPPYLNLVVRIFVARECPAKTFQNTISTIKNLSTIAGAKAVIGDELVRQALLLSAKIVSDLEQLLPHITNAKTGTDIQGVALNKFSPNASDQNKLLRVLTALDHLFEPKKKPTDEQQTKEDDAAETEKQDLVASLYENPAFGDMWSKLSACLGAIRQQENMINVATILLPLIESLMVVCKNAVMTEFPAEGQKEGKDAKEGDRLGSVPPPDSRLARLFLDFTGDNRRILNELVRQNPKLMSGTFALLVKNPKVLEFDNKRNYFNRNVRTRNNQSHPHRSNTLNLQVRREDVFTDSFKALYYKPGDELKYGKLNIKFMGEEGVDAGGVTREWFQALSREMSNANWALFTPVSSDRTTFHPNKLSSINPEHLMYFKFIGRIIAKALYEGRVLDCHFSRAVYKRILGKSVSVKDVESFDPEYYKSLIWMLENDITDIITETFSVEDDEFGVKTIHDLVENGRDIAVTEENKHDYVRLVVEHKLLTSVQEQMQEFLKGFHEIIPAELIAIFGEQELELLISGLPDIDVDDWRANTEYQNYNPSSPQIQWFWRALRSFDKEELAKLLQFVTGTSKVPLNGFKELEGMNGVNRFNIHRDYGNKERLPSSHTCFNQLDLPEYESYEELRSQLLKAITAGSDYFGFA
jgi:E3 ubiquitin-protein ligase HUWE1